MLCMSFIYITKFTGPAAERMYIIIMCVPDLT